MVRPTAAHSSPDPARSIILTVPEARDAFAPLEKAGRPREGATGFEIVSGDVATIRARADNLLTEWDALRRQLGIASRFNDPTGFLRGVAGHFGVPCVIFVRTGATHSIVIGEIEYGPLVQRIGNIIIKTPRLCTLRVVETGILCAPDASAPAS